MQLVKRAPLFAALFALAPLASASTYIVDRSGSGQFADIQLAILASSPGDVLLVQPGTYGPFTLDRGVTIIGYGNCNVAGPIGVLGVPFEQTAALVRIEATSLDIQGCPGHVLVQDVQQLQRITVSDSLDVRLARVSMPPPAPTLTPGRRLDVVHSRVELVSSSVFGEPGMDCANPAVFGGHAVVCANSRLHMARSSAYGGTGGACSTQGYLCGDGGTAVWLQPGAEAILCGRSGDAIQGGAPGINWYYNDCTHDGVMGYPVFVQNTAQVRRSGVTIFDWVWQFGINCTTLTYSGVVVQTGGVEVQPSPADPTLTVSGNPAAGSAQAFTLDAPAGSAAVLSFGTWPVVQADPSTVIEWLVQPQHNVSLGVVGAGGSASFTWPIPSGLRKGATVYAQAHVTLPGGEIRRTNSVPVIVR